MRLLKRERIQKELSFEEVARRAGWANESIPRRMERPGSNPTLKSVRKYADAIGMELRVSVTSTRVVSFFNHAGGVGKTSAARDIGYVLAGEGFRVLLIDADPQANLTSWLSVTQELPPEATLYTAMVGEASNRALPEPLEIHGMELIPASLELAGLEPQLVGEIMGITRLRGAVNELAGYDFVLIDCPPSLGQLSAAAVIASEYVVVPVPTSIKGFQGIKTVTQMVGEYRQAAPQLEIAMFLLTHYDSRTSHDRQAATSLAQELSELAPVSTPLGERPAIYKDASLHGVPVPAYEPGGAADGEIRAICEQLLSVVKVDVNV